MSGRVYVTGVGVVSAVGLGREAFWEALCAGRSGISRVENFDTEGLGRNLAGEVKGFRPRDHLTAAEARRGGRVGAFSIAAARMSADEAKLTPADFEAARTAVVMGTTMFEVGILGELDQSWIRKGRKAIDPRRLVLYGSDLLPIQIARALRARAMVVTLPAACAAGNYAIGYAADLIRAGRIDVAVAGGVEMMQRLQFSGFVKLGAMAPERCQPFDLNRQGMLVGEGSGMMVLESEAHAVRRGATPLAEIGGYGLACDAYHITRPHPEGAGIRAAMEKALSSSGVGPGDVDFINAHGTGTKHNDATEARAIREVFGDRPIPATSIKSIIGHTMGAASAIEAVSCVMTVESGVYPPTIGYETPDPECALDVVANQKRTGKADVVLNNSAAFGGYDAVVVFAKPGKLPAPAEVRA